MNEKLKPCPYCGSVHLTDCYVFIRCDTCLMEGPKMNNGRNDAHADHMDNKNAIAAWNKMHRKVDVKTQMCKFNANDAREIEYETIGENIIQEYDKCVTAITKAAKENKCQVSLSDNISIMTTKLLNKQGFKIVHVDGDRPFDPSYIIISW